MATAATHNKGRRRQYQSIYSNVAVFSVVIDPVTLDAAETVEVDVTGLGVDAALGDIVEVGPGVDVAVVAFCASVTTAGTVTLVLFGPSTGNVNMASSTWNFVVKRISPNLLVNA